MVRPWRSADDRSGDPVETTGDEAARATAAGDDEAVYAGGRGADDGWLGAGLATALILAGVLMFLFPEPATSFVGIVLIAAGLAVWVVSESG